MFFGSICKKATAAFLKFFVPGPTFAFTNIVRPTITGLFKIAFKPRGGQRFLKAVSKIPARAQL